MLLDKWKGGSGRYEANFEYGTSLFHYIRVVCIYMPLILLSNVLTWGWVVFTIFILPVQVGSATEYVQFLSLLLLGLVMTGVLCLFAIAWANRERPKARHAPTVLMMFQRWIRAKHQKVRPMITFVEKGK